MPSGTKRDTEQVKQLQAEIFSMQNRLNWTYSQLAQAIYCELNEDDDYERIEKFVETLKKQLKRNTTSVELLQRYIHIISNHHDFQRADLVRANPISLGKINQQILIAISKVATKRLIEEKHSDYD